MFVDIYVEEKQEIARVMERKDEMIMDKTTLYKKFLHRFRRDPEFDTQQGICCFRINNTKGVRYIMFFDIAMFFFMYRSIPAFFALTDFERVPIYLGIRKITFYIHSALMLLALLSSVALLIWSRESPSWQVTFSVAGALAVYLLMDLHFQKCL